MNLHQYQLATRSEADNFFKLLSAMDIRGKDGVRISPTSVGIDEFMLFPTLHDGVEYGWYQIKFSNGADITVGICLWYLEKYDFNSKTAWTYILRDVRMDY